MSTWITIPTINDTTIANTKTSRKQSTDFNRLMKTTPARDLDQLKKHNDESFAKQEFEDKKLLDAFTNKKLKSKAAIKKALGLAKKHNDAGKDKNKAVNPQDNIAVEGQ